jgi:hypothetical protein
MIESGFWFSGRVRVGSGWSVPAVLTGFTFHEGRHTHRTWLADDNIPDVARAARLGHKLPGMADVYEHVTPAMEKTVRDALTRRWKQSVRQLTDPERQHLAEIVPAELRPSIANAGRNTPSETHNERRQERTTCRCANRA